MDTKASKQLRNKAIYGPLSRKTPHSALKRELLTNFGFENMTLIADLLTDRVLAIVDEFSVAPGRLQPYQTMIIGVDKREEFGYGTRIVNVKLKPAIISLITPEEILELAEGTPLTELRPRTVARIIREAFDQQEIARRVNHDPQRVDKYIKNHRRIVTAHEAEHSFDQICLLTGLSPKLVQEHLDWYQRLTDTENELTASD